MAFIDTDNILTLLGQKVAPGESATINFNLAKLYTTSSVEIPVIVERSQKPGPVILITSGIHGDEINGVEIVRQLIAKKINKPKKGTVICIPVLNIFGFLDMKRAFPDGRDLNRVFPGNPRGSLASRFAYQFVKKILPIADYCIDFHTGGASRFNAAQIRIEPQNKTAIGFAKVFNAPFTLYSKTIPKSYRATCSRLGVPVLLFEGGKSKVSDKEIARVGVDGTIRFLNHLGMLRSTIEVPTIQEPSVLVEATKWMRAKYSGLMHVKVICGQYISKGDHIATITDPYGKFRHPVNAPHNGYIINVNEASLVYQGDAIFNISTDKTTRHGKKEAEEEV
ncbi:succinylglutamate desuccinylase/aspartoacylase family protein [uncultured Dokdonia sp.]|uniref:succinylglutamate desuccinylase/aspartoacylase family protein n=1 Tax=uncultured Dokdonia sp. TaxID=575653 RepID=UPI00263877A5|nr:succinylglutamate desuccinylase/aspartoacylase family protein [uncultured Dokdonia sp.]